MLPFEVLSVCVSCFISCHFYLMLLITIRPVYLQEPLTVEAEYAGGFEGESRYRWLRERVPEDMASTGRSESPSVDTDYSDEASFAVIHGEDSRTYLPGQEVRTGTLWL